MNDFLLRLKKYAILYREWIVITILLVVIIYLLLQYTGLTKSYIEKQVLRGMSVETQTQDDLNYQNIVDGVMNVPNPYVDLVKFNPFEDIEIKIERRKRIEGIFLEGVRFFEVGSFRDAEQKFQQVLQEDTYEVLLEYKPYKPSRFIEKCQEEAKRHRLRATFDQAEDIYRKAQEMDKPGGLSPEELLNLYLEGQRLYGQVVDQGEVLLPEAVSVAQERLVVVDERVNQLKMVLFHDTLRRLYDDAVDLWNRKDENLSNLADAKDNLDQAQENISTYGGNLTSEDIQVQSQVTQLLSEITTEINRVYPIALQESQQLESTGKGNLEKIENAQEIYKVLFRFQGDEEIQAKIQALEEDLKILREDALVAQAGQWLEESRTHLENAKNALTNEPPDWNGMQQQKDEGLAVIQRILKLTDISRLESLKAETVKVQADLKKLKVLPRIEGLVLQKVILNRRAEIVDTAQDNRRYFIGLGEKHRISGITFLRIGESEGGLVKSIWVKKDGFRETEIFITE